MREFVSQKIFIVFDVLTAQVIESILIFTAVFGKVMASPSAGLNKINQVPGGARGL